MSECVILDGFTSANWFIWGETVNHIEKWESLTMWKCSIWEEHIVYIAGIKKGRQCVDEIRWIWADRVNMEDVN